MKKLFLVSSMILLLVGCSFNQNNSTNSSSIESSSNENSSITSDDSSLITSSNSNTSSEHSSSNSSSSNSTSSSISSDTSYSSSNSSSNQDISINNYNISYLATNSDQLIDEGSFVMPSQLSVNDFKAVYGTGSDSFRMGSSKNIGYVSFNISEYWKIQEITIRAYSYGTDGEVNLKIELSNSESKTTSFNNLSSKSIKFEGVTSSNSFTISTTATKKRVIVESIEIKAIGGSSGEVNNPSDKVILTYNSNFELTNGNMVENTIQYEGYYQPAINNNLNLNNYSYWYGDSYLPSVGKSKILVVPVDFVDYRAESKLGGEASSQQNIYDSFFGDSDDTGWESVRSYYEKSSYGALSFEGQVTPWFNSKYTVSSFANLTGTNSIYPDYYDPTWTLLDEVCEWAKTSLGINLSEYDTNNDGLIDGVWMIYSCPEDYYQTDNNIYWAYTYSNYDNYDNYDEIVPFKYAWASYNFMFEGDYSKVDAHTYIHETGHMLGLDDYYNYDQDSYEGVSGGVDMMDYNIGDHSAYSKYLLNWTSPYVIDGTKEDVIINLKPFESSGEFILLANSFNDSPYDEYIIIEYYTPTGLNEKDLEPYSNGLATYSQSGVKISHIDSRIVLESYTQNEVKLDYVDSLEELTLNEYYYYIGASNTPSYSYSPDYNLNSDYRLLHLIEATNDFTFVGNNFYQNYGSNEVLFHSGDNFSISKYSKFFVNGSLMNDKSELPYEIYIGEKNSDGTISITINKI